MGMFSWLYSNTGKQMLAGVNHTSYLLVPNEFKSKHGEYLEEDFYNGYGQFGIYDVYELVADWNKAYINPETFTSQCLKEPTLEQYGGMYDFEKEDLKKQGKSDEEIAAIDEAQRMEYYKIGLRRYKYERQMLTDFCNNVSDKEMKEKYGASFKREIGIDIAAYDEDNEKLKYPIKITDRIIPYEDVAPSKGDPDQGCR